MKDTVRQYGRLAAMGLLLALLPGRGVGGDEPPPAELEAQIARLGGTAATTRLDAARALARLGSTAATAAPALRAALRDPDPDVRSESALALLRIGTSPDSLTAWRAGLADADERVRFLCAEGLRRDPEHSAPLRPDALTHDQADPGLAGLAPARDQARPTAVRAQITRALRDRDPHVRAAAVRALAGPWAEAEELPLWELLHALDDAVASVRVAAVDAVAKLRSGWVDAGASIRAALSEPDPTLRRPRTLLYRQYLLRGRTLAPHLESLAKSGSTSERALALALFSTLTNDDRVLWEPVAECAGAREVSLRLEAMLALQRIHIYADWGPDLLLKALADPDSRVRQAAAVACRRWMFRWPELARYQVAHPWGASPQEEQAAAAVFHGMEHPEQVCAAALVQFLFAAGVGRSERNQEIVRLGTPALAPVLSGLSRQAPAVRAAAAELLGDLLETYPWRQEEALPALIAALSAPEAEVRRAAAESLARILSPRPPLHRRSSSTRPPTGGDPAPAGVPDGAETILRAALADPAVAVRAAVALALSAQRPADVSLAPELARVVRLHENEGGGLLAEVLETLDPATSESLLQDLAAGAPLGAGAAQECAAAWARRPSPAPTLLRIVCRSVRSPGTLTRRAALRGLECDEADLRDLWPDLAVRLFDRDAEARGLATGLLGGRTESTEFAMTELAEVAGGSDQAAAVAAIRALARLGSRARVTLPGVRAAALSADAKLASPAVTALLTIEESPERAIESLRPRLASPLAEVRAQVLADLAGDHWVPAVRACFLRAARDPDARVRAAALAALTDRGPGRTIPAERVAGETAFPSREEEEAVLIAALQDAEPAVRAIAAQDSVELTVTPVPALLLPLQSLDDRVAALAVRALGTRGEPAVTALTPLLNGAEARMRRRAACALALLGRQDPGVLLNLRAAVREERGGMRTAAITALVHAARSSPALTADLARAVRHPDPRVRVAALRAADGFYPGDSPLIEELRAQEGGAILGCGGGGGARGFPEAAWRVRAIDDGAWVQERTAALISSWGDGEVGEIKERTALAAALVNQLAESRPEVRAGFACALGRLGGGGKPAVAALERCLAAPESPVRRMAAEALGRTSADVLPAVPALARALGDPDPPVRRAALRAVAALGPRAAAATPAVLLLLESPDEQVRAGAISALGSLPQSDPAALQALRTALSEANPALRRRAAVALRGLAPAAASSVAPELALRLTDPHGTVRAAAGATLRALGLVPADALPALLAALDDPDDVWRLDALALLGYLPGRREEALPALTRALNEREPAVRGQAAESLARLGESGRGAIPALLATLDDPESTVRETAAYALARLGVAVHHSAPILAERLPGGRLLVRREALRMIRQAGPAADAATPALAELLADVDPAVRSEALEVLAAIGPGAATALPALLARLDDDIISVRVRAVRALVALGAAGAPAVPRLIDALARDPADYVRAESTAALVTLAPDDSRVAPAVAAALTHPSPDVRAPAARALARLGPRAAPALPALVAALRDPDPEVRGACVQALGALGPAAAPAIPALHEALNDSTLAADILDALAAIQGE